MEDEYLCRPRGSQQIYILETTGLLLEAVQHCSISWLRGWDVQ